MYVFVCLFLLLNVPKAYSLSVKVVIGYKMFIFLLVTVRWDGWTWVIWQQRETQEVPAACLSQAPAG